MSILDMYLVKMRDDSKGYYKNNTFTYEVPIDEFYAIRQEIKFFAPTNETLETNALHCSCDGHKVIFKLKKKLCI